MLDDIRNSGLLIVVSGVAIAVLAIAVQPQPQRDAAAARRTATASATLPNACRTTAMATHREEEDDR
jgi:hypothetical protein